MTSKILKFKYTPKAGMLAGMREVWDKFMPGGRYHLNRTKWRGKEPRSCAITRLSSPPHSQGEQVIFDVEVTYRPKGHITYTGKTRYNGWTAMVLAESGAVVQDGQEPAYTSREVFNDAEFNDMDFGEFVGEFDVEDIKRTTTDAVFAEIQASGSLGSAKQSFMVPHRSRPLTKIALSNEPTREERDGFGTRILNIDVKTDGLEHVLMQQLTKLMCDYIEGKVSLKSVGNSDLTFVVLSDVLVDCEPNEIGEDSWFDVLHMYTPITFLENLARQLEALYELKVELIPGKGGGLVLRRDAKAKS